MFKRKNKGEKTKEKKSTSTNKNWWETGVWQGKIEEGRLHIYTWLMVEGTNNNDTTKSEEWNKLKSTEIPGLEYWTLSKWRKVGSWKSGDSYTSQGNECGGGWHLRQPRIQAKKTKRYWDKLLEPRFKATLSVENKYEKSKECCDRRARKNLRDEKRKQSQQAVEKSKITVTFGQAGRMNSEQTAEVVNPELKTLYSKLSECMLKSVSKFGNTGSEMLERSAVEDEYLESLKTEQDKNLYYLTLLIEKTMLELLCFDGPTGEQDNGLSSWLRELEGEKKLTIDNPKEKKSWKLKVSELLYTLYRALIYTYQERYLHRGLPGQSLTYIVDALGSSIKTISNFTADGKIPTQLIKAFGQLSAAFQSTVSFIKAERERIKRGETINYIDN